MTDPHTLREEKRETAAHSERRSCQRCGEPLRVNPERNPEARLLRHADEGVCAGCAMTAFLKATEPLASIIAAKGPDVLLAPAVHATVGGLLAAGNSDAAPSEINWRRVVEQWEL